MHRSSGILMPVSALPSKYGIGTFGRAAYDFTDFLEKSGQKVWQMLPLGPTGYGDSPYSPFSSYAGNPYFIDLETLCADGLLDESELDAVDWGTDPENVDYGKIYENRSRFLKKAYEKSKEKGPDAGLEAFKSENSSWLRDYAMFMALKGRYGMAGWTKWPDEDVRLRRPEAMRRCEETLGDEIEFCVFTQYLFYRQWDALRAYVKSKDISIIGDLPIYVALDSSDVWADPGSFVLDEKNVPVEVSGVPPDYFCEDGQLWGNPIYDWKRMAGDGFGWWIRRIDGARRLYDIIRIDHFRGLESYWSVPWGAESAREGEWRKGPGMALVNVLKTWFADTPIIAEDLGFMTPEVKKLLDDSGFPGMKVLEFAFDSREPSDYLPHTYDRNCVCYVGTHDNETLVEWFGAVSEENLAFAERYLGLNDAEGRSWGVIRGGMSSVADLFVAQMQDYLELGAAARMNVPGTSQGNWRWRMLPGATSPELAAKLRECVRMYGR